MNIIFIYNKENKEYDNLVKNIEFEIKNKLLDLNIKCFTKNLINSKIKKDVIVIISDDLIETNEYLNYIKNLNKLIIITNNLSSEYIVSVATKCVNICHCKISIDEIIKRIYRVYIENSE